MRLSFCRKSEHKGDGYIGKFLQKLLSFLQFQSYSVSFSRDVVYLISLNRANLNNRKIKRKGYLKVILQLGMRSFGFSQK